MASTYQKLQGPLIVGTINGFPRYWELTRYAPYANEKRKKPKGAEAILSNPTNWTRVDTSTQRSAGYESINGKTSVILPYAIDTASTNLLSSNEAARLLAACHTSVMRKIKDEKWNAGIFAAELAKTRRYFASALETVLNATLALLRGRKKLLKKLAQRGRAYLKRRGKSGAFNDASAEVSRRWMEWRYAVCPVVYDLEDMLKYLNRSAANPDIRRAAGGANAQFHRYKTTNTKYKGKYTTTQSGSAEARMVAYFRVHKNAEAFKHLGLINLGAVLWEVTPLSFVVDWFLPIGDKIAQLDALVGVDVLSVTYSQRIEGAIGMSGVYESFTLPKVPYTYTYSQGPQQSKVKSYQRIVTSLKTPMTFTSAPKGKQLADAIALARLLIFRNSR